MVKQRIVIKGLKILFETQELKEKLKTFFIEKYRNAGNHRISKIKKIDSEDSGTLSFSFNLKCIHKEEPYDLDFILKLFLEENGFQQASEAYSKSKEQVKRKIPHQKIYFLIESKELFGFPFILLNRKEVY